MEDVENLANERLREIKRAQHIIDGLGIYRERLLTLSLESTPEMRARIRELATDRDDFDRAVLAVLRDLEKYIAAACNDLSV